MKRSVIRIVTIASILAVFAILSGPASAAGQENTAPTETWSYTTEDGRAGTLHEGMIISQGMPTASGGCVSGAWDVYINVNTTGPYESVVGGYVDANCTVHVDEVSLQRQEPPSPRQALWSTLENMWRHATGQSLRSIDRYAYTKSELNDEVGIDLMMARVDIEYVDDGSAISDGDVDHECDKIFYWDLHSCTSAHNDTSPTRMWGWTRAEADGFAFRPTHAKAKVTVMPDEDPIHRCYNGRTYQGTHWRCRTGGN